MTAATEETKQCRVFNSKVVRGACDWDCPECHGSGFVSSTTTSTVSEVAPTREDGVRDHGAMTPAVGAGSQASETLGTLAESLLPVLTAEQQTAMREEVLAYDFGESEPAGTIRDPNPHIGSSLDSLAEELGEDYGRGGPSDEEQFVEQATKDWPQPPFNFEMGKRFVRNAYQAGRASRDGEPTPQTILWRECCRAARSFAAPTSKLESEKDARIASLTAEAERLSRRVLEAEDARSQSVDQHDRLEATKNARIAELEADLSQSKESRDSAIERAGAMDRRNGELVRTLQSTLDLNEAAVIANTSRYTEILELKAALQLCMENMRNWQSLASVLENEVGARADDATEAARKALEGTK